MVECVSGQEVNDRWHFGAKQTLGLFDHLVSTGEKRFRHCKSDFFRSFEIDNKIKLSWLIVRNICGFCAVENLINFDAQPSEEILSDQFHRT
jgi:hypothetical protein